MCTKLVQVDATIKRTVRERQERAWSAALIPPFTLRAPIQCACFSESLLIHRLRAADTPRRLIKLASLTVRHIYLPESHRESRIPARSWSLSPHHRCIACSAPTAVSDLDAHARIYHSSNVPGTPIVPNSANLCVACLRNTCVTRPILPLPKADIQTE